MTRFHQIRNATAVLELAGQRILIDPMLGDPGTLPPYAVLRSKARKNPLTPLPPNTNDTLQSIDAALITHIHFGVDCDHLDKPGAARLAGDNTPTFCRAGDERALTKRAITARPLPAGKRSPFLTGHITPIHAAHGRGVVGKLMGPGAGYVIELPDAPTVYLTGDTVLTDAVLAALEQHQPDICIAPGGGARLDLGGPVLMNPDELVRFIEAAPGQVIINHIGALNHCPTTADDIRARLADTPHNARVHLPADGETLQIQP